MRSDWMNMAYYWICPCISVETLWKGKIENEQVREREGKDDRSVLMNGSGWKEIRVLSVLEHIGLWL